MHRVARLLWSGSPTVRAILSTALSTGLVDKRKTSGLRDRNEIREIVPPARTFGGLASAYDAGSLRAWILPG